MRLIFKLDICYFTLPLRYAIKPAIIIYIRSGQLPRLTFYDHKMKALLMPHMGSLEINYKLPPYLIGISSNKLRNNPLTITMTDEYLPYVIGKLKI